MLIEEQASGVTKIRWNDAPGQVSVYREVARPGRRFTYNQGRLYDNIGDACDADYNPADPVAPTILMGRVRMFIDVPRSKRVGHEPSAGIGACPVHWMCGGSQC